MTLPWLLDILRLPPTSGWRVCYGRDDGKLHGADCRSPCRLGVGGMGCRGTRAVWRTRGQRRCRQRGACELAQGVGVGRFWSPTSDACAGGWAGTDVPAAGLAEILPGLVGQPSSVCKPVMSTRGHLTRQRNFVPWPTKLERGCMLMAHLGCGRRLHRRGRTWWRALARAIRGRWMRTSGSMCRMTARSAFVRDRQALQESMSIPAAYLMQGETCEPYHYTPEMSWWGVWAWKFGPRCARWGGQGWRRLFSAIVALPRALPRGWPRRVIQSSTTL